MNTLLVTSAAKGDGKTTIVYNLGVAFAQHGAKVLLIDGDMRNPHQHERFGAPRSPGLSEFLLADNSVEPEVVCHSKLENLFLLPAGARPEFASELVGSKRFQELLQSCASQYDYVLIDSPPMMGRHRCGDHRNKRRCNFGCSSLPSNHPFFADWTGTSP